MGIRGKGKYENKGERNPGEWGTGKEIGFGKGKVTNEIKGRCYGNGGDSWKKGEKGSK